MTETALFLLFFLAQVASAVLARLLPAGGGDAAVIGQTGVTAVQMVTAICVCEAVMSVGLGLWFYRRRGKGRSCAMRPFGLGGLRPWCAVTAVAATVAVSMGVALLTDPIALDDQGMGKVFGAVTGNPLCLLQLVLLGPLAEELVFRAGIEERMLRRGLPVVVPVAVSALTFAVVHANVAQGVAAFVVGIVLGLLYLRTRSLSLCLPAHIANNGLAVVLMAVQPEDYRFSDHFPAVAVAAAGGVAVLAGAGLLWRTLR